MSNRRSPPNGTRVSTLVPGWKDGAVRRSDTWAYLTASWAIRWVPGRLGIVRRDSSRAVPPDTWWGYEITGPEADQTLAAIGAVFCRSGRDGLERWLDDALSPERGEAFWLAAYRSQTEGWYRSDGCMVQRSC